MIISVLNALFQSHAGSIEVDIVVGDPLGDVLFQSHAGSIEVLDTTEAVALETEFQSHAGSIEALYSVSAYLSRPRFNPTLVRLRGAAARVRAAALAVSIPRWFD